MWKAPLRNGAGRRRPKKARAHLERTRRSYRNPYLLRTLHKRLQWPSPIMAKPAPNSLKSFPSPRPTRSAFLGYHVTTRGISHRTVLAGLVVFSQGTLLPTGDLISHYHRSCGKACHAAKLTGPVLASFERTRGGKYPDLAVNIIRLS